MTIFLFSSIIVGLCIGSFLNMLIYRLPRHISFATDRSRCIHCNHTLSPLELIPFFSYIFLRGKCKTCKATIPIRYFLVELITACLGLFLAIQFQDNSLMLAFHAFFFSTMIALFFIDLEHYILPDKLTGLCFIAGLGFAWYNGTWLTHIEGILACVAVMMVIKIVGKWVYKKDVLGLGDVKLAGVFGACWGLKLGLLSLYLSFIAGGVLGAALLLLKQKKRGDVIPYGPAMIFGCFIAVYWGHIILPWIFR